jgi:hypothetical protein
MSQTTPNSIFPTDDWEVAQHESLRAPLIVLMRTTLPPDATQVLFSRLFVIAWIYEPTESGLPDTSTYRRMKEFGDALESGTLKGQVAYQALTKTGNGKREWLKYTADAQVFTESLNSDLAGQAPYPMELRAFADPTWEALREYQVGHMQ